MIALFLLLLTAATFPIISSTPDYSKCFVAPNECPNSNVTYYLYTQKTQKNPHKLDMSDPKTITEANFIKGRPFIILIHGYTGHRDFSPNTEIRPAYFAKGEFNIVSVDYHPLAEEPCYVTAVQNLKVVANCTAQLLDFIILSKIFTFDDIHVIGFSLGGQTSGIISTYMTSGKLKRITALDPAKPLFVTAKNEYKIDSSDAEFVQIIHTDVFERGILHPTGHVDFFPNGGFEQPGCHNQNESSSGSCNHVRAPEYYAESITSDIGFWGYRCAHWYLYAVGLCTNTDKSEWAIMGEKTPSTTRGLYFLETNNKARYAKGKF